MLPVNRSIEKWHKPLLEGEKMAKTKTAKKKATKGKTKKQLMAEIETDQNKKEISQLSWDRIASSQIKKGRGFEEVDTWMHKTFIVISDEEHFQKEMEMAKEKGLVSKGYNTETGLVENEDN